MRPAVCVDRIPVRERRNARQASVDAYIPTSCCRPLLAVTWPELVQEQLGKLSAEQLGPPAAEALAECKVRDLSTLGPDSGLGHERPGLALGFAVRYAFFESLHVSAALCWNFMVPSSGSLI